VLPFDVWVEEARQVSPAFHPRYDAISRTYRYRLGLADEARSPFHRRWCWPLRDQLDSGRLGECAALLRGEHSFEAFAKAGQPERGTLCTILDTAWSPWELGLSFTITANRFLHHMVRYLVGTIVDVASGRRSLNELVSLLAPPSGELLTSPPAPPQGLFLERVQYPAEVWG
jgi:tRNA pseudouridine38-40 synthase